MHEVLKRRPFRGFQSYMTVHHNTAERYRFRHPAHFLFIDSRTSPFGNDEHDKKLSFLGN